MEQEVQPSQLLSPNGENGIYSSCSEAFDEILSHLPEAASPAPRAEHDVVSDDEDELPVNKKDKPAIVKTEKIVEEDAEMSPDLPEFIQDWKSAEEMKKVPGRKGGVVVENWKVLNGDATEELDLNINTSTRVVTTTTTTTATTTAATTTTTITDKTSIDDDVRPRDGSMEDVAGSVRPEIDPETCAMQARQLHQSPRKPAEELDDENIDLVQQEAQQQIDTQQQQQQDTVFTVQFQVSASIVELPEDNSSDEDDVTSSKNGSEETVLREDQRSGEAKSSPDDAISVHDDDDGKNLIQDGDEKTYIYEIFQPMRSSGDQTGSATTSREAHLTRVMMTIRDQEIDGCIERRSLAEDVAPKDDVQIEEGSIAVPRQRDDDDDDDDGDGADNDDVVEDELKVKDEKKSTPEERMEIKRDPQDDLNQNIAKSGKEVRVERTPSLEKVKGKFKEDYHSKSKSKADWKGSISSITPDAETTSKKSRTPSSSTPLIVKSDSTKSIREEEMPAPNSTKVLLAKFKSLERENSLQRLDRQPRPTRSSCMTLSTSSLSGSFDRHSHSSGKQLAGRHQAHIGAELTYPQTTRSPSESVCSSDWDTESYGSDILQQHLLQSTQHLPSKDGEEKEESVLLTKSLLAQWKMLEEHERRLKQLEKTEKGSTESDAKIRSRSLGRLQSSIDKRILETPDDHPLEADVLNNSASLSKSLTLPKATRPSQMRNESPASMKDQYFLPSCTRSDSSESLQLAIKAKDLQQYLPPPYMTRYVLAKFKELENKSQTDLSTDPSKKAFKWEVKEATPIGAYRGSSVEFRYRKPASYDPFYRRSYSEEPRRIHFEMKAQDAITEEAQPQATTGTTKKERSPKHRKESSATDKPDVDAPLKVDVDVQSRRKGDALEEAKQYVMKRDRQDPSQQSKKVVKSLLSYFNSLDDDKMLSGKK